MEKMKMKVKKFNVQIIPVEVEYIKPVLGQLYAIFVWFRALRLQKCVLTLNGTPEYTFYRFVVPKFMRGSTNEE